MTKYYGTVIEEEHCTSYMRKSLFPESNREAIIEALKNLHAVYSKKYSNRNFKPVSSSTFHDYQKSQQKFEIPEDELIKVSQYVDENDNFMTRGIYSDESLKLCDIRQTPPKILQKDDFETPKSEKLIMKRWRKAKNDEKVIPQISSTSVASQTSNRHLKLNTPEIPFIAGKSTGKSHSMSANLQEVISLMRTHNLALCKAPVSQRSCRCKEAHLVCESSNDPKTRKSLKELQAQLHDEYVHLRIKHEQSSSSVGTGSHKMEKYLQGLEKDMELKDVQIRAISQYLNMESPQNITPSISVHKCRSLDMKVAAKKATKVSKDPTRPLNKQRTDLLRNLKDIQQSLK